MTESKTITKEEQIEVKRLKRHVEKELKLMKSVNAPMLQISHLERILRMYKRIHEIEPPKTADKLTLNMVKIQYKGMCAIQRVKPMSDVL